MQLIDTHCHPHFDDFLADPEAVLRRAREVGVDKIIAVGVDLGDSQKAIDFASKHENVWAAAGIHPHGAKDFNSQVGAQLRELLNMSGIVAAGEIGLDFYRLHSSKDEQLACLRAQLEIGQSTNLPFIFHVRDAWADFWRVIDEYKNLRSVIHSFTGGPKQLDQALSRGFYVALNGIVTFTKDQALIDAAKKVPLDRLVLETDAPFLLPARSKNKICEPSDTRLVAEFLAELRGEDPGVLATATTKNAVDLFDLEKK